MKISRRRAIQLSILGSSCLLLPFSLSKIIPLFLRKFRPFELAFQIPPLLQPIRSDATTDYYEIVMEKASHEIIPGLKTELWGYNGISPGPTIRQAAGRQSQIRFINKLGQDVNQSAINAVVHLHGMPSQPQYDGYTMDLILYPNDRVATLWYHDHVMDLTWRNVYMGLLGLYIVEDDYEKQLPLPKGEYDIPLILESKQFATDGSFLFNNRKKKGLFKSFPTLINGVPYPRMDVAARKYRFRILNGSAKTFYQLALSLSQTALTSGEALIVIGNDGGLIDKPITVTAPETLHMSMAERYEVIIDFSKYPVGTQLYLQNTGLKENVDFKTPVKPLMRFDVVRQMTDDSEIPEQLRPFEAIRVSASTQQRTFSLANENKRWTINHQVWDENRIDARVKPGNVEIWTLVNSQKGKLHPMHLHNAEGQILDRNGKAPFPYERGWKDVFHVGAEETLRVALKFATREGRTAEGRYMMHCHHLQHEDNGMMSQFIVGQEHLDPVKTAAARPLTEM
jgi:spore coat protein A, manganese oxidase